LDFGFWIFPTGESRRLKLRKNLVFFMSEFGGLQPILSSIMPRLVICESSFIVSQNFQEKIYQLEYVVIGD